MKDIAAPRPVSGGVTVRDASRFKVWRPVLLGMYHSVDALILTLKSQYCGIDAETELTMRSKSFLLTTETVLFDLAIASPRQLGFTRHAPYGSIFAQGIAQGLLPCPIELPAQLRRQYLNQPEGEILRVVSRSKIPDARGRPHIFTLIQYAGARRLGLCVAGSETYFGLDDLFVWICPQK